MGLKVVSKCTKTQKTLGKISNMVSLFWHDLAIQGPKNGPKLIIFPNALFLHFPMVFADDFGPRS